MAITGSGTQEDPFIVHSYTELKSVINISAGSEMYYINLDNDIDCNDYGAGFEWNTIAVKANAMRFTLDMQNHTIKNIKVAANNWLFTLPAGFQSIIKNGKILNVFLGDANGFCNLYGGEYADPKFQNVSISMDVTGAKTSNPLIKASFDSCAVYVQGTANTHVFGIRPDVGCDIRNTDIKLKNFTCSSSGLFTSQSSGNAIINSRIRGDFNSTAPAGNRRLSYAGVLSNCVIDLESSNLEDVVNANGCTGVINTEKASYSNLNRRGMTAVNSSEIINGDALRAKGFTVVNVSA